MWKDDKKPKPPQTTPSILVRKKPIPSQSFQNSNSVGKEFDVQKQSPSTSSIANNNKENYGKQDKILFPVNSVISMTFSSRWHANTAFILVREGYEDLKTLATSVYWKQRFHRYWLVQQVGAGCIRSSKHLLYNTFLWFIGGVIRLHFARRPRGLFIPCC